jgi:hypothetical protein
MATMSLLLILLIILAVIALAGGGWGYSRADWGYRGFSPLGLVILVIVVLLLVHAI